MRACGTYGFTSSVAVLLARPAILLPRAMPLFGGGLPYVYRPLLCTPFPYSSMCRALRAPKRRIGGSGSPAGLPTLTVPSPTPLGFRPPPLWVPFKVDVGTACGVVLHHLLYAFSSFLVPLGRAALAIVFLALLRAVWSQLPGRYSPLGRLVGLPCQGAPVYALRGLGCLTPSQGYGVPLPPRPPGHAGYGVYSNSLIRPTRFLLGCLLLLRGPVCVWAAPEWLPALTAAAESSAAAHARALELAPDHLLGSAEVPAAQDITIRFGSQTHTEPPGVASSDALLEPVHNARLPRTCRPHDIPIEELADYIGPPLSAGPIWTGGHAARLVPLDADTAFASDLFAEDWLGVTVLTPHHLPVRVALRCGEGQELQYITDLILAEAPGVVPGIYDACVPVRPTRFRGYGTFIRFPSVAKSCPGCPHAAVVLDLSFVGGHYYACLLPCDIPFEELYAHAVQQATYSEIEMRVHVGESEVPHPPGAPFHLRDGDVVTFQRPPQEWHPRQLVPALLADRASWSPPAALPATGGATGLLVQHRQERIFMPAHHHYGQSPVEAIRTLWDYAPGGCTVCAFPTPNLEFRGNRCSHAVYMLPIPNSQPRDPPNFRRRDVFTLCDFRGIGYSVRAVHSAVHLIHLPSVAAAFGYHLDARKRLGVYGRPEQVDELIVEDLSVLTICAVDRAGLPSGPSPSPPGADEPDDPEDEDALPNRELAARLWPSAVAARGTEATRATLQLLARRRSRSRSRSGTGDNASAVHGDSGPVTAPASAYSDRPGHAHDSTPKPEASTACPLQVYVAAPFYGPELFQANLLLPCDPADATRQVARQLRQLALPFAGVVVEACPQPCASCLVFVVLPEWLSFAGGSAVVLDMRSTVRDDRGPLLAAFLSRPTDCSEIRREAGAFAIGACDVYIGNSASPLDEHEYVTVPSGTTIRLSRVGPPRTGYLPLSHHVCRRSPVLVGPVPRIPQPKVLLLLHHSGKFLFSGSASPEVPLRDAIARFVGANHEEVTFHTPRDNGFAGATYRGVFIRDVLAILERREPIDGRTILFLDLRQVGASFQFLCLEEPKISYDALEAVLPRPPPLGWRLAVSGGRRYRHHLSVQHCDIVILGFVHQADGPADFYSLSSSSEAPPSDEDGEEENDTDDASVGSTRSPSRPLPPAGGGASPSSDKSYKGGLPGDACDGFASASAVVPSYSALIAP